MKKQLSDLRKSQSIRYENYSNEEIKSSNWENTTIEGCVVSDCNITQTSLQNSDVLCTSLLKCRFINTDFSHSDICSIISSKSKFVKVDFSTSTMRDCEFVDCVFVECSFEHIAMTNTKFINCSFKDIKINQSSSYLNEFYNCNFDNCHFKGNFFYSVFIHCSICEEFVLEKHRAYNAFFNTDVELDNKPCDELIKYLKENFMFLNIEIYRLNLHEINIDTFMLESLLAISQLIKHGIVIRLEQIEMLQLLFEIATRFEKITLLSIQQSIQIIDSIFKIKSVESIAIKKSQQCLNQLKNMMYLEYVRRVSELPKLNTIDFSSDQIVVFKITYEDKPPIQLSDIINCILEQLCVRGVKAKRIKTENGSFIEFIEILKSAAPLIQIILSFTTGIVMPLALRKIDSKHKTHNQNSNQTPPINVLNSSVNSPTIINNYTIMISNFDSNTQSAAQATAMVLEQKNINAHNNYLGYSIDNLKSIEIVNDQYMK